MNYALIFAGGTGTRMNSKALPKQFLEYNDKPIIIYTIELFENHSDIDGIVVVCLEKYIDYLKKLIEKFEIKKVIAVVPGGVTGQESIFNGLKALNENCPEDSIVLVHDGVRPLIDEETITKNIKCAKKNGNAITISPSIETVMQKNEDDLILNIMNRDTCFVARAPQTFRLKDLYENHLKAQSDNNYNFIDSACLMKNYGSNLYTVIGPTDNIKITTPIDFYIFRAIKEARENSRIFG